tara:strand:- start:4805 stop:5629 length:825 start_codon:yes stop_codon:yes gene_type:complete
MLKKFFYYNSSVAPTPPSGSYILDDIVSTPIYAWSFTRYLASAWVGNPVVRLRREVDNVELDFNVAELTDGTAEAWAGGGDAKSTIWYDQSGNGNNIFQTNSGYQYKMIIGGVMWRDSNGYPSSRGNVSGSIRGYTIPSTTLIGTNGAVFTAFKSSIPIGLGWRVMGGHGGSGNSFILAKQSPINGATPTTLGSAYANGVIQPTNLSSVDLIECIVNAIGINWTSNAIWTSSNVVMFNYMEPTTQLNEAIVFNTFTDSERAQIETNQNDFYGYF